MPVTRMKQNELLICIGKIRTTFGTGGQLKIQSLSDIPGRFEVLDMIYIGENETLAMPYEVEFAESRGGEVILKLAGYDNASDVDEFRGRFCYIPESERPRLEEGEYYQDELQGLRVITVDGEELGTVDEILEAGGSDLLVLWRGDEEIMIPLVEPVITEISIEEGYIRINPVEGMIDDENAV